MPASQWPGMWQPTTRRRDGGRVGRDRPDDVDPLARARRRSADPATSGGTLTTGVGPGRRAGRAPPRPTSQASWTRGVADDRLVDLEPAVDDVEQDRLAGHEVDGVGQERVVLGDDVDLARRRRRAGHDRRRRRAVGAAAAQAPGDEQRPTASASSATRRRDGDGTARSL